MNNLNKIAGAGLCAALLAACGEAGNTVFPATKTLLAPLTTTSAESVLYRFKGYTRRDGQDPEAGLTALNGEFYGTTAQGGGAKGCKDPDTCGTVYRVSPSGREQVLYRFKGMQDGSYPSSSLLALDGTLYGTTLRGGENNAGAVFAINPSTGAENVIYSFKGQHAGDGDYPQAGLIAINGVLYGTTVNGGSAKCKGYVRGCGIVFSVTTSGTEQVLHLFNGDGEDRKGEGRFPYAGLTAMNGLLYGTTSGGGRHSQSCFGGCGTVFEMSPSGSQYRVLYRFKGGKDGVGPNASLVSVNGRLYGTTNGGGGSVCNVSGFGCGTVFEMSESGNERILHRFTHGSDGAGPDSLVAAGATLYGTTIAGGAPGCQGYGCGSVFELNTSGRDYAVLHGFLGSPDGVAPSGPLLDVNGLLYGTTASGGKKGQCFYGCFGTVFELTP
ncbi:MAG TPA: choice-of-anchor tandem repeat GloVer-containing protein [Candidatus Cybelea sp.]